MHVLIGGERINKLALVVSGTGCVYEFCRFDKLLMVKSKCYKCFVET